VARQFALGSADLRFFVAVASASSLAAASRSLDVSRSAVTQRLSQLEARIARRTSALRVQTVTARRFRSGSHR